MKTNQNLRFYWRKTHNKINVRAFLYFSNYRLILVVLILFNLITKGIPALSIDLFTQSTPAPNEKGIVKCTDWFVFFIVGAGTLIGTPIGVLAGTYLAEYGRYSRFAQITRFLNDILLLPPFYYYWFVCLQLICIKKSSIFQGGLEHSH